MPKPKKSQISARKKPIQDRSARIVDDILEAAIRVLIREGGERFTTVRVAEEAGVSVGSLYQYFPNKAALLFRLQADEWTETWTVLEEILSDQAYAPLDRLRRMVQTFFRSERQEAALRNALDEAGAPFRDSPEAAAHLERAMRTVDLFMADALPNVNAKKRIFYGEFVMTSLSSIAEKITEEERSREDVDAWAKECADMVCAYLTTLRAES
jgi:AcrR family transcriptional regulator